MKKQIHYLSHLLEKNHIGVPVSIKKPSSSQDSYKAKDKKDKGKGKVLVTVASSSSTPYWVIHSGALHHMGSSQVEFSSLEPCDMSSITLGDDTPSIVLGRESVEVKGGTFINFLNETPSESIFDTSPKSLDLLGSNHDYDSLDEIPKVEESYYSTNSKRSDRDPSPSTLSHSSEDEDSPPDSPTIGPLWAK
eukprot:Gb_14857 [translate_table: standard]